MWVRVAAAIVLWLLPTTLHVEDAARLALLIGNQGYSAKIGPLKNPHNDINLVDASLKRLGFKVTVLKDASYKAMDIALKRYVTEVRHTGPNAISFFIIRVTAWPIQRRRSTT
jgi:Caspase domain